MDRTSFHCFDTVLVALLERGISMTSIQKQQRPKEANKTGRHKTKKRCNSPFTPSSTRPSFASRFPYRMCPWYRSAQSNNKSLSCHRWGKINTLPAPSPSVALALRPLLRRRHCVVGFFHIHCSTCGRAAVRACSSRDGVIHSTQL